MHPESAGSLTRARSIARLLDSALRIPGTNIRFGLDAVVGLIPGLGDAAGAALAAYFVLLAARIGAPAAVILRMLGNIAVDAIAGAVPVLGDLFDIGWKANLRNVALLERYLDAPGEVDAASRAMLAGVLAALVALAAGGIALGVLAIRFLFAWTG